MGIYIKGMEMPKSCISCKLCDYDDNCILQEQMYFSFTEQQKNCPLIEVKAPHGDLVDLDVLDLNGYCEVEGEVVTVIEAEVE